MMPDPSSHPDDDSLRHLLAAARAGSADALAELLEKFRPYLQFVANNETDPTLRAKHAPSDAVQETLFAALQKFGQFRGQTAEDLAGWLKEILFNHLIDERRRFGADKRDVGRELPLDDDDSHNTLPAKLVGPDLPPDQRLIADEDAARVRAALERLPDNYTQVILLRTSHGLSFAEIGRRLGRSEDATRMRFNRAMEKLREQLGATDER
jgi:RNA polymerase sigma-70 factor (ECF subfamily)